MGKRNAYGAMFMSFMAGMALLSGSEYSVLICLISLIVTVFVANDWGLNGKDEEDGQTNEAIERISAGSEEKGA